MRLRYRPESPADQRAEAGPRDGELTARNQVVPFTAEVGKDEQTYRLADRPAPSERRSQRGQAEVVAGHPASPSSNDDVWVVVRCFNEATVVGGVIAELRGTFPNMVGVDDGSSDNSREVMTSAGARVVRHAINLGAGAALQTGLTFALLDPRARYFLCFDADGQHRVADAAAMVERLRSEDVDILLGSRFLGSTEGMPASRRRLLRAARIFEGFTSGLHLSDAHNGLRAFTRKFAEQVDLTSNDMSYATELLSLIARSGLRYAEHPVTIQYTEYSLAKGQRSVNSVNIALDVWMHHLLGW